MDARAEPLAQAGESRRRIGEIFVELGFISGAQLEAALEVQHRTGGRIGEILVEQGSLTRLDLASALADHWEPHTFGQSLRPAPSLSGGHPHEAGDGQLRAGEERAAIEGLEHRLQAAEEPLGAPEQATRGALLGRRGRRRAEESALAARLALIEARLAVVVPLEMRVGKLQKSLDELAAVRAAEAVAFGARLSGAEAAVSSLGGLDVRVQALEQRFEVLSGLAADLRGELDAVAGRPVAEDPVERLRALSLRIDQTTRDGHDRARGLVEELRVEVAARAAEVDRRLEAQAGDTAALRASGERTSAEVAELVRRLDAQAAAAEEQTRVTEQAVRAGLASLGKRLVGPDARYSKPGKGLRRSLDRLGAAIVEADARQADAIPPGRHRGYVAFVPTPDGYRLVERGGKLPKVGATVELEGREGSLVVVRHGRSPLPFDDRRCAYLDVT